MDEDDKSTERPIQSLERRPSGSGMLKKQHVKMLFQRVLAKESDAFELVNSNSVLSSSVQQNNYVE